MPRPDERCNNDEAQRIINNFREYGIIPEKVYTQEELDKAVKDEREANIKIYNHMLTHIEESPFIKDHIAKKIIKETLGYAEIAIRKRGDK